jgi:hypothetical protein
MAPEDPNISARELDPEVQAVLILRRQFLRLRGEVDAAIADLDRSLCDFPRSPLRDERARKIERPAE